MKKKGSTSSNTSWVWKKWIAPHEQDTWAAGLDDDFDNLTWALKPSQESDQVLVEVFAKDHLQAKELKARWGGRIEEISDESWLNPRQPKPLKLGKRLTITHDPETKPTEPASVPCLCVPYGMAFGSGDHETTEMLLRALVAESRVRDILDLGTGSGILALAGRKLGSGTVTGVDFESDAIRICRENEALNFKDQTISWIQADLSHWQSPRTWPLIIANLYSDLLITLAPQIKKWITPDGELWMSGILKSQADEVAHAYSGLGCNILEYKKKGKWVMLKAVPFSNEPIVSIQN